MTTRNQIIAYPLEQPWAAYLLAHFTWERNSFLCFSTAGLCVRGGVFIYFMRLNLMLTDSVALRLRFCVFHFTRVG